MWKDSAPNVLAALSDAQLVHRYLAGDHEAFNHLLHRWEKRIYNFTLRHSGRREDAQDLLQEIFTSVSQKLGDLREAERFGPWLYKIALNHCRMRFRSEQGRAAISLEDIEPDGSADQVKWGPSPQHAQDPEQIAQRGQKLQCLREAIAALPEEQRVVILLKEYEGLKFHEIAEILECPLSTVKSRLYLGFRAIRGFLEKKGIQP